MYQMILIMCMFKLLPLAYLIDYALRIAIQNGIIFSSIILYHQEIKRKNPVMFEHVGFMTRLNEDTRWHDHDEVQTREKGLELPGCQSLSV